MNLSAPFLVQFFGEQMSAALAYCDYVFGNESEAAAFGEKHEWGTDISAIALKLAGERILTIIKIRSSCEMEDFVETHLCKLCVILRSRVYRWVCVLIKDIGRRLPLEVQLV